MYHMVLLIIPSSAKILPSSSAEVVTFSSGSVTTIDVYGVTNWYYKY